jgi:hypothetical protein
MKPHTTPTEMGFDNEKTQQLFLALETLRKAAQDRFDKRRDFEWRIALALWAAMGALGALGIAKESPFHGWPLAIFSAAIVLGILVLHTVYLSEIERRNSMDSDLSFSCEDKMRMLIHWDTTSGEIKTERDHVVRPHRNFLMRRFVPLELTVTLFLGVLIVSALGWKAMR